MPVSSAVMSTPPAVPTFTNPIVPCVVLNVVWSAALGRIDDGNVPTVCVAEETYKSRNRRRTTLPIFHALMLVIPVVIDSTEEIFVKLTFYKPLPETIY